MVSDVWSRFSVFWGGVGANREQMTCWVLLKDDLGERRDSIELVGGTRLARTLQCPLSPLRVCGRHNDVVRDRRTSFEHRSAHQPSPVAV